MNLNVRTIRRIVYEPIQMSANLDEKYIDHHHVSENVYSMILKTLLIENYCLYCKARHIGCLQQLQINMKYYILNSVWENSFISWPYSLKNRFISEMCWSC